MQGCTGRVQGGPERDKGARGVMSAREGAGRGPGDGVRVKGTRAERDNGARACTGRCRGSGQRAITVHGDGARVHGKVQATAAERDNGARRRCTGRVQGKVQGTGAERDNGARACTRRGRCRGPGRRAITVHGDGARVHGKAQGTERDNGARGRCTD